MGRTVNSLKALGKKCSTEQTEPNSKTISAVFESIEDNFDITGAYFIYVLRDYLSWYEADTNRPKG